MHDIFDDFLSKWEVDERVAIVQVLPFAFKTHKQPAAPHQNIVQLVEEIKMALGPCRNDAFNIYETNRTKTKRGQNIATSIGAN